MTVVGFHFASVNAEKKEPIKGKVNINNNVAIMFMEDSKKVKDILAGWKKNQSLPKDVAGRILNTVLNKCNVQALILADQVGLPPPIPLPKVKADN